MKEKQNIFLMDDEHRRMEDWLKSNEPDAVEEFRKRSQKHGTFQLYDRENGCQFAECQDSAPGKPPRCKLDGSAKPKECRLFRACS